MEGYSNIYFHRGPFDGQVRVERNADELKTYDGVIALGMDPSLTLRVVHRYRFDRYGNPPEIAGVSGSLMSGYRQPLFYRYEGAMISQSRCDVCHKEVPVDGVGRPIFHGQCWPSLTQHAESPE